MKIVTVEDRVEAILSLFWKPNMFSSEVSYLKEQIRMHIQGAIDDALEQDIYEDALDGE